MSGKLHRPLGLIGQIFAILLLAILIEFGASTFFYERANEISVHDDEALRLAEHLAIARKLLDKEPLATRPATARELTTARYAITWRTRPSARLGSAPALDRVHSQIIAWEPTLAPDLTVRLAGPARSAVIVGGLALADGSWMEFSTRQPVRQLGISAERILLALAPAVALTLIGGTLVRQTLLPMRRLALAADRFGGDGAEAVPLPLAGPGEVRQVIDAFNRMQQRIHRLIADRTQALAAIGHDLRTPLARLRLRADDLGDDTARAAIRDDVLEMEAMIASLLAYLSGGEGEAPVPTDLAVLCATIADDARDRGRLVHYRGPHHLELPLRRIGIKRALVNLVENGLHHAQQLWITLRPEADAVVLSVEDDGPGIPAEMLDKVTQPFVRLDSARGRDTMGLGLGLAIVMETVKAEGGSLRLANRTSGGLHAEIRLLRAGVLR